MPRVASFDKYDLPASGGYRHGGVQFRPGGSKVARALALGGIPLGFKPGDRLSTVYQGEGGPLSRQNRQMAAGGSIARCKAVTIDIFARRCPGRESANTTFQTQTSLEIPTPVQTHTMLEETGH